MRSEAEIREARDCLAQGLPEQVPEHPGPSCLEESIGAAIMRGQMDALTWALGEESLLPIALQKMGLPTHGGIRLHVPPVERGEPTPKT